MKSKRVITVRRETITGTEKIIKVIFISLQLSSVQKYEHRRFDQIRRQLDYYEIVFVKIKIKQSTF